MKFPMFFSVNASKTFNRFIRLQHFSRSMSTEISLRRSYLYVPSSSDRMLAKSLTSTSDMIIYDLEDSVSPSPADKKSARQRLVRFLSQNNIPNAERIAVRVNDINTPFFYEDITQIMSSPAVRTLVLPKIHSAQDIHHISREIYLTSRHVTRVSPLRIIPSIESARALWNIGSIAGWKSEYGAELGGSLSALLFAAEDCNCADTSILRSSSRKELLYTRSQIVVAAKAFGLEAIDMVCVNYKDVDYLKNECEDGRQLGFTGKQAIHPAQIDIIQSTFVPTSIGDPPEINRAAKIVRQMELAHASEKGAVGLEGEMIDAPMLKQAEKTLQIAKAAGLEIPLIA